MDFSIVMPLYNKEKYVIQALDSIRQQSYQSFEVIIVNDGSTDSSSTQVKTWIQKLPFDERQKFILINKKNEGVSVARNTGVQMSQNEYIALLDCDDYWEKDHLKNLKILIDNYSQKVDLFSNALKKIRLGNMTYPKLKKYENFVGIVDFFKVSMISSGFIHSSSACVKKRTLLSTPFPEDMKNFEDLLIWARVANNKGFAFNSTRQSVNVVDNSEAAKHIDFNNFIKFEKRLLSLTTSIYAKLYIFYFFATHLLYLKITETNQVRLSYIRIKKFYKESKRFLIVMIMLQIIPSYLIVYVRKKRQKK